MQSQQLWMARRSRFPFRPIVRCSVPRLFARSLIVAALVYGVSGSVPGLVGSASAQALPAGIDPDGLAHGIGVHFVLDLPSLLPPGTLIVDNFCYNDTIFGCIGRVDATIHSNPLPAVGGFSADITLLANTIDVDVTLHDIAITTKVKAVTGIGFTCYADLTARSTVATAEISVIEIPGSGEIDATQVGDASLSFGSFSDSTDCDGFLGFIVEFFLGLLVSDLQSDFLGPALVNHLNTVDGNGNTPIAAAIESALEPIAVDWVTVGDPGNACDTQAQGCFGSVAKPYRISQFEVTNAQYARFLNAVAATDTNALYSTAMGSGLGGITQSGTSGSFVYSTIAGREDLPVSYVSFWDAARFANWLHNGQPLGAQGSATTEDGAYTLTPTDIANNTVTRNVNAEVFIPSEDEWYKAAYYDTGSQVYYDHPASSDAATSCTVPGATANTANCDGAVFDLTNAGSYPSAESPTGTFDQGGNVREWNEFQASSLRGLRGGFLDGVPGGLAASFRGFDFASNEGDSEGFRVASSAPASGVPSVSDLGIALLACLLALGGYWVIHPTKSERF